MKKTACHIALLLLFSATLHAQVAGTAGAFARLGYGARGMGMGNSMTAVTAGEISTFYNPALAAFSEQRTVTATASILSLDRYLNFLSYTQAIEPTAGLSVGLINAGVRNIDGRDADAYHTEDYSTTENQFFLSFSNRVDERVSLGLTVKLYYSKLFEEVSSTTVGFDAGICIRLSDALSLGGVIQDINSKYKWDTKSIYGQDGKTTEDKFPNLRRIALAYTVPNIGLLTAEFESSSDKTNVVRFGAEYQVVDYFSVRGGVDRWDFSDDATGVKPSLGFSVKKPLDGWTPSVNYAYVIESFSPDGMHIITLSASF